MDVKYIREEIEKKYDECHATWGKTNNSGIAALRLQFATFWNWVDLFIEDQDCVNSEVENEENEE